MKLFTAFLLFLFGCPFWIVGFIVHVPIEAFKAGGIDASRFIDWLTKE